ncbi:MAG: hypothetical protein K2Y32_22460 [Candidatus Obscuribacterales bacterium]|nr:hypothetical protein [Candidatus Obscuribacterales bacterium]
MSFTRTALSLLRSAAAIKTQGDSCNLALEICMQAAEQPLTNALSSPHRINRGNNKEKLEEEKSGQLIRTFL